MDINKEEMKKTLLEKTEGIRKVLGSKPAVKGLLGKKLLVALVGVVLVAGIAVVCKGTKKVPDYLEVEDKEDGTWVTGYDASIIPENLKIPDGIVGIVNTYSPFYQGVFYGCELLESVKISGSVKTIEESAFGHCTSLASVTLAKGVEEIGSGAFRNCTSLASVTIHGVSEIGWGAFYGCTSLKEVRYKDTIKQFKAAIAYDSDAFEKGVVIHCTDGDHVFGSDTE